MSRANTAFLCRQRPAAGACLAALTATFPVCFLEPDLNQNNPYSIYNTANALEREGISFSMFWPLDSESLDSVLFLSVVFQSWGYLIMWRTRVPSCLLWNRLWET